MTNIALRRPAFLERTLISRAAQRGFELDASEELHDPSWDTFIKECSGGVYVQSSLWAQVKALNGWRPLRVTASRDGRLVGGAQILYRSLPLIGGVGYVPGGPLFTVADDELQEVVMAEVLAAARHKWCQVLLVQPVRGHEKLVQKLPQMGLRQTTRQVMPEYTSILDLSASHDDLLAQMKSKTRYHIRLGQRKGLVVREGTADDLVDFYRVLELTAQRQNFKISSKAYYDCLYRVFGPQNIKLFVAEHEGKFVSGNLAIAFGDTVYNKMPVWSGEAGHLKPNEALTWQVLTWAKEQGYRYYDFGGISSTGANALLRGDPLPEKLSRSVTSFKLGFGGQVVAHPKAHLYFSNPLVRWADSHGLIPIDDSKRAKKFMHFLRTR